MPFTISHVAAVLPFSRFLRRGKLLSAAVIGSMVPDFGLFMPTYFPRSETHGLVPLFTFCLPVGLVCYWLFQLHIKPATLELLPGRLYDLWRQDAIAAPLRSLRQWLFASVGILLGGVTHLAWDGFTHENGRGVRMLGSLETVQIDMFGHQFDLYRFLQHASSVVGLLIVLTLLGVGIAKAQGHPDVQSRLLERRERRWWFGVYVAVAGGLTIPITLRLWSLWHPSYAGEQLTMVAIASLWGTALSLIIVSALVRWRLHTGRKTR